MSDKAKDWVMCVLFWVSVVMLAYSFSKSNSCLRDQEPPLIKRLAEQLWPQ